MNPEKIASVSVSGTADVDAAKSTQNTKPLPRQERFFMHVDGDHGRLSGRRALSGVGGCTGWAVGGKDIEVEERAWHGVREGGPGTRGSSSEGMMGSGPLDVRRGAWRSREGAGDCGGHERSGLQSRDLRADSRWVGSQVTLAGGWEKPAHRSLAPGGPCPFTISASLSLIPNRPTM